MQQNEQGPQYKPPWYVQLFLWAYGFLWLNMIFVAGLNSLRLGYIDEESVAWAVGLSLGFYPLFKYFDKRYEEHE